MNCRNSSTPNPRRTWAWLKTGLLSAAFALFGTAQAQNVDVNATAGTAFTNYGTLKAAFDAINLGTHQGVITINIIGNTTETLTASLNSGAVAPAVWTSMSIQPTGAARIIEGSIIGAIVKLNGADNVTIDGRIAGTGRNLTIRNNQASSATAAVWLSSVTALNGCVNDVVRNCEIACGAAQNTLTNTTWGIIMNGTTISNTSNGVDHANNTFQENRIIRCRSGIVTRGTAAGPRNQNIQVIDNIIGPTSFGPDQIGVLGIGMQADDNSTVSGNTVQFIGGPFANTTGGADRVGIAIGNLLWSATTTTTITSTGYTVSRNLIHDIIEERTFSAAGIILGSTNGANPTNNVVCSNIIYNLKANGTGGDMPVGVGICGGNGDQVVYNSIRMEGDVDPDAGAGAATNYGAGIRTTNTAGTHINLTLKNNIVYMDLSSSSGPTCRYYCVTGTAAAYTWGTGGSNNNDFYYNTGNAQCLTGGLATASGVTTTTQFTTLANWQTAYTAPQDGASIQADPGFISATDLHINVGSTAVNNLGTTAGVTCAIDYDNEARSGTPDIGADEYTPLTCAGADGGTIAPATASACVGGTYVMTSTGSTVGAGITNQWNISLVPGGPYSPVAGGSGATTTSYTTGPLTAGTYYYVMTNTCSFGGVDDSNELTLTVNPQPSVSVDVPSANYCTGSPAVALLASGASTYAWLPVTGLDVANVAGVNASPAATTTYTVTGTDGNGCSNTATSAITVLGANPVISSTTATPNPTCFNGNSQLQVNTAAPGAYCPSTHASGSCGFSEGDKILLVTLNGTPALSNPSGCLAAPGYTDFTAVTASGISVGGSPYSLAVSLGGDANQFAAAFIDWNQDGDFADVNEFIGTSANVGANGIATFVITVPPGAFNGTTRMRVLGGNDSAILSTQSCGASSSAFGETEDYTVTISGGTSAFTYLWTPNTFLDFDNIANPLASAVNVASQAYSVLVTSGAGCSSTGSVTLTTSAPITAATISGNLGFCTGGSTTLTAVPTDGAGPYTYLWAPGGEITAALSVTVAGTYSCQVTDACGGSVNTGNVSVVENPLPTVSVAPTNSNYCTGSPAIALSASGASNYAWLPAAGLDATNVANVNASPSATTTYTVTGTDGNGCVNTATSAITVLGATPVITSTTAVSPICPGSTSQLQVNLSAPSYCTASATNGVCGSDEFLSNVTFGSINNTSVCTYGSPLFSYNDFTAQSNAVTAGSSLSITATISTFFSGDQLAAFFDWNQDGDFSDLGESEILGATVTGANTWPVNVPAGAVNGSTRMRVRLNFNAVPPACGTTGFGEIEDYTVVVSGGVDAYTYLWSPAGNLSSATIANPVATLSTSEAYTVTVTSLAGCSALGTTSVTVSGPVDDGDPCTLDACLNGVISHTFQDADGDLTCDANDGCPLDPLKIAPGQCGCGVADTDTDGDLTADCNDGCPADPLKIAPGICGCGFPDTGDADGDLTLDCVDGCPLDPLKITAGLCGCGVPEGTCQDCLGVPSGPAQPGTGCDDLNACTINDLWSPLCVCTGTFQDTDGDLTCDANDGCPLDPLKIAPGVCGCGVADTDTDGDGLANCVDPCPNLANLVNGDPCDDGDPCTINDVVTACVCAGTPAPVTAGVTASSPVYCTPGAGVTLTATGGVTYSWLPAAGLSAVTGSPVTATPASATTYTVTATNAVGCSDTETVSLTTGTTPATPVMSATPSLLCPGDNSQLGAVIAGAPPSYCTTSYTNGTGFGDFLTSVEILTTTLNNATGASATPFYTLFAASGSTTATLTAGTTYTLRCIAGTFTNNDVAAWIDYNNNGVFDQPAEKLGEVDNFGATPAQANISFTVPLSAINGQARLRVRESDQATTGAMPACGSQSFGEVEDYTVTISGGASNCAAGINFSWSPTTYLNNPLICNPLASAVLVTTPYTVTATNAAGCFSTGNVTVNVETTDTDGDLTVDCLDGCPLDANKIAPGQCGCGVADTDTDGDLTADCNDGCINDPLKIAPGICGCGVADTDTDGDLTADCNDLCPLDPNKTLPGQCGCGVADTDTDGDLVADCVDNCPLVPGVVGTPCNDGNPLTINDQLTAGCVCAGTVPTCAFNTVLIDLTTDNNGGQTSWDVVNVGTSTQVCTGSGYLNNQVVTLDCCLPNGCYELRFFDSAGDGMANGIVGGYILRQADGKRIIDNGGDGIFTSTSQIALNQGFCVPLSTDAVISSHCDKINWLPTDIIQITANPAVTGQFGVTNSTSGYWFWFFNPDGGYTRRILQTHAAPGSVTGAPANIRASYLRLSDIVTQPIPFFTNLNVRVRTRVAGVDGAFGPACRFKVDPPCATTQLTNLADPVVSCGATGLTLASTIYAINVVGATKYQFEFSRPGYLRRIASPTRSTVLGFVTLPLMNNTCYNVRVRVSFDGGLTYCSFGTSCSMTIGAATCPPPPPANAPQGDGDESEHSTSSTSNTTFTVWPNPNDGTLVNISLNEFDASVNNVGVDVMDIRGRVVSTRTIAVDGGSLNMVLPFEQTLAPGLYMVNLQVGETRYTERLVIQ